MPWWRNLFPRKPPHEPADWTIKDGERELFRLEFVKFERGSFWMKYRVCYLAGTPELWREACDFDQDPARLGWRAVHGRTGQSYPLDHFIISAEAGPQEAWVNFVERVDRSG